MAYQIIFGAVSILVAVYAYNNAGLADPFRTLFGAIFIMLALATFLDVGDDGEMSEDE